MDHTLYTVQCLVNVYVHCQYTIHMDHTLYTVQCMDIKSNFSNNYCWNCPWCYAMIITMYVVCKSIILSHLSLSLFVSLFLFSLSFSFIVDQINAKLRSCIVLILCLCPYVQCTGSDVHWPYIVQTMHTLYSVCTIVASVNTILIGAIHYRQGHYNEQCITS